METHWASPPVLIYSKNEDKEHQTGAGTPTPPSKPWLYAEIRKHCSEPSTRSLPTATRHSRQRGCVLLIAPSLAMAESPFACTCQRPQLLVLSSIYSVTGARQACQRPNPRCCQGSRIPLDRATSPASCVASTSVYRALPPALTHFLL